MKLLNETRYPRRELRSIITAAYRYIAQTEGPLRYWPYTTIRIRRRITRTMIVHSDVSDDREFRIKTHVSGRAWLNGTRAVLTIPTPDVEVASIAWVVWHEIYHLYGYRHRAFPPYPSDDKWKALLAKFPERLTERSVVKKVGLDSRQVRFARTLASIDRWALKLRRAETALRKLRARRNYYEKVLGVAAKRK